MDSKPNSDNPVRTDREKGIILLLGGYGFVGRRLALRLAAGGWRVRLPVRRPNAARELQVEPNITQVPFGRDRLPELAAGCQAAINLVGILNESKDGDFERVHAQLTGDLLAACQRQGVGQLLQMSALNADPQGPSEYLRSKGRAEQILREQAEGLRWSILQPSVIFGPGDSLFNRFAQLLELPGPFPLACPQARFAPVFVDDVVGAFESLLNNPPATSASYQLCGPRVVTLKELVEYTAQLTGKRKTILALGPSASRMQARLLQMLPGKPFSMDSYQSLQIDSICTRNGLAELGIRATPMEAVMPFLLQGLGERRRYRQLRRTVIR